MPKENQENLNVGASGMTADACGWQTLVVILVFFVVVFIVAVVSAAITGRLEFIRLFANFFRLPLLMSFAPAWCRPRRR